MPDITYSFIGGRSIVLSTFCAFVLASTSGCASSPSADMGTTSTQANADRDALRGSAYLPSDRPILVRIDIDELYGTPHGVRLLTWFDIAQRQLALGAHMMRPRTTRHDIEGVHVVWLALPTDPMAWTTNATVVVDGAYTDGLREWLGVPEGFSAHEVEPGLTVLVPRGTLPVRDTVIDAHWSHASIGLWTSPDTVPPATEQSFVASMAHGAASVAVAVELAGGIGMRVEVEPRAGRTEAVREVLVGALTRWAREPIVHYLQVDHIARDAVVRDAGDSKLEVTFVATGSDAERTMRAIDATVSEIADAGLSGWSARIASRGVRQADTSGAPSAFGCLLGSLFLGNLERLGYTRDPSVAREVREAQAEHRRICN